jgi:hypothetical protein
MKPNNGSPTYLVRNPYSFCFRMIVPEDLQKFVGRKELRYTLKTGYVGVAKQKARFVAGQVQLIFKFLRKGGTMLAKLSEETIPKLVHQYIKNAIESWNKSLYEEVDPSPFIDAREFRSYVAFLDAFREDLIDCLNLGDFSMFEKSIGELLKRNGINHIDKDSLEYRRLCTEIHTAEIQLLPIQQQHMLGDFSYKKQLPDVFPEVFPKSTERQSKVEEQKSKTLQKVFDAFWKESSPYWKPRTVTEFNTCHKHLLVFLGPDRMIHTVDYQVGGKYKDLLSNTITKKGTQMSPARVDLYLGYAAQVFKWAIKRRLIIHLPARGTRI